MFTQPLLFPAQRHEARHLEAGLTPIGLAVHVECTNAAEILLRRGVNINATDQALVNRSFSLLHVSLLWPDALSPRTLSVLLKFGASIHSEIEAPSHERDGFIPIHLAACSDPKLKASSDAVDALIEHGAAVQVRIQRRGSSEDSVDPVPGAGYTLLDLALLHRFYNCSLPEGIMGDAEQLFSSVLSLEL